jgi:hypothetical protein
VFWKINRVWFFKLIRSLKCWHEYLTPPHYRPFLF